MFKPVHNIHCYSGFSESKYYENTLHDKFLFYLTYNVNYVNTDVYIISYNLANFKLTVAFVFYYSVDTTSLYLIQIKYL